MSQRRSMQCNAVRFMNRYIHEKLYNMIYLESPMRSYQWETFEKDLEDMQTRPNANHVDLTRSVIVTNRPAFSESLYEVKINGHSILLLFWIPWAKFAKWISWKNWDSRKPATWWSTVQLITVVAGYYDVTSRFLLLDFACRRARNAAGFGTCVHLSEGFATASPSSAGWIIYSI